MGNAFTHGKNVHKISEAAIADVVEKTIQAISNAPELKALEK